MKKTTNLMIRVEPELIVGLKKIANARYKTLSQLIRDLLWLFVENNRNPHI